MKQLNIITSMDPKSGGPCQGIRNISPYFPSLGIYNEVLCLDNPKEDYGVQDYFPIVKIGPGRTSYQYQPELFHWLTAHLSNYDIVVVHGIWQYHNFAVYKAIKQLQKENKKVPKVVIMFHGMMDPYFQKATERKWKALRNELVWRLTEKRAINAADAIFFTCEEELLLARTTFKGYLPNKEINVGYGIQHPPTKTADMEEAFQRLLPALKNKYWLFLSRIHPKKGIDLLIDGYNQLSLKMESIPDLVIAGPTDSDYAKQMMQKANKNPKIHFSGMLSGDSKWGSFYGCEAYLLPSHQENFGIAIVEAMASKKPVLITKNVNIWREIEAGKGGWILDELTTATIEKQLLKMAQLNNQQLKEMGEQAYATFEQSFSIEERARVFVKTIKEI